MPSQIDFAIAAGLFIVFTAAIIMILLNYLSNYFNITTVSDLRTVAYDTFYAVFSGMGIPSNWETTSYAPVKLGLVANLYEIPFFINETNGTARTNETVNATFFLGPFVPEQGVEYDYQSLRLERKCSPICSLQQQFLLKPILAKGRRCLQCYSVRELAGKILSVLFPGKENHPQPGIIFLSERRKLHSNNLS